MTHIANIHKYPTKKAFKDAIRANPDNVFVDDPSFVNPVSGSVQFVAEKLGSFTVTNHPKRSWFAKVSKTSKGVQVS